MGDDIWYQGRGSSCNEPTGRIYGRVVAIRPDGWLVIGNVHTGSCIDPETAHHTNDLVRLAREV